VACFSYSDCYYAEGGAFEYIIRFPEDYAFFTERTSGWAERFTPGNDTLMGVWVYFYISTGGKSYVGSAELNGLEVNIYPDDGAGNPDVSGGPLATRTIAPGAASMFAASDEDRANVGGNPFEEHFLDFSADNLVLRGPHHVCCELTGPTPLDPANGQVIIVAGDFLYGGSIKFPSVPWENTLTQAEWLSFWGNEISWVLGAEFCKDEFNVCRDQALYILETTDVYGLLLNYAGRVKGQPVNRLEAIRWQYVDPSLFAEDGGDYKMQVVVWSSAFGMPGVEIWRSDTLGLADLTPYPGWNELVIPGGGIQILGDFFIGYEDVSTAPAYFYYAVETGQPEVNQGGKYYSTGSAAWRDLGDAIAGTANAVMEASFCSIPVEGWTCVPGNDWATPNQNYARTGHSGDPLEDAWCDLNFNWSYLHAIWGTITCGPIIYEDYVIQAFSSGTQGGYWIFDLMTGAVLDSMVTANYGAVLGGGIRCQPTVDIVNIEVSPGVFEDRPILFTAGGTANAVGAWDLTTVGGPINLVWEISASNGWQSHNTVNGFIGSIRYAAFVVLDGVLYFGADDNFIYAADAATGAPFVGWDPGGGYAPVALNGTPLRSGATDGSSLFYCSFAAGTEGDVYSIDAATGALNWSLSTGPSGLQADDLYGAVEYVIGSENFNSGIAYHDDELYVSSNSTSANVNDANEGVFYRINSLTGEVLSTDFSQRTITTHPLVDQTRVMVLTTYTWGQDCGILGGSILSFDRSTGLLDWVNCPPGEASATWGRWTRYEGVLSCEPDGAPDILVAFTGGTNQNNGYLTFVNAENGAEFFSRRIDHGAGLNHGGSGAMGVDSNGDVHVVFADWYGFLFDLTKGDDRPRLDIMSWDNVQAVPFNTSYDTIVTFPEVYSNTGCADLVVSLVADDTPNTTTPGGAPGISAVRGGFSEFGRDLADVLAENARLLDKYAITADETNFEEYSEATLLSSKGTRDLTNRAALAVPGFLVTDHAVYPGDVFDPPGGGYVIGPGDVADVSVYVNGPLVNRGPQGFYVEFQHNDPDYFLNDTGAYLTHLPQARFSLVGGCLIDTTFLDFGPGAANFQVVANMGRIMNGAWDPPGGFIIDGIESASAGLFQGTYAYAAQDDSALALFTTVWSRRVALNSQNWYTGSTENEAWISMQADPNWVDTSCTPFSTSVIVAQYWDGSAYQPLNGNMVAKSYIDSVGNFDQGGGVWDWTMGGAGESTAPFDNDLTMGLQVHTATVGVLDAEVPGLYDMELLNNGTFEIMKFNERNGDSVIGWKFGAFIDHDINLSSPVGGFDTVGIDRDVSAAWVYDGGDLTADQQFGFVKLPFGCGQTPIKNVLPMERAQVVNSGTNGSTAWDSLYFYFSQGTGIPYGHDQDGADDQDATYTFVEHDFGPNEEISFAISIFHFDGITDMTTSADKIADFANLANKASGWGRGDVDNDGGIGFADIIYLAEYVNASGPGPIPFQHLGDVDASGGDATQADVVYLFDYYFNYGPCPAGDWLLTFEQSDYLP
jgi:hypothetical protein